MYTVAIFETIWEKMNRLHRAANGDKSDFDANKYGDLNDESLLDGRINSKEQFEEFMRYHSLNNK